MLELKPNCENCACELPPESDIAMICSYECTFCRVCVEEVLSNVCPNCGGGFCQRPVRPKKEWVKNVSLSKQPASDKSTIQPVDTNVHAQFCQSIQSIPPNQR